MTWTGAVEFFSALALWQRVAGTVIAVIIVGTCKWWWRLLFSKKKKPGKAVTALDNSRQAVIEGTKDGSVSITEEQHEPKDESKKVTVGPHASFKAWTEIVKFFSATPIWQKVAAGLITAIIVGTFIWCGQLLFGKKEKPEGPNIVLENVTVGSGGSLTVVITPYDYQDGWAAVPPGAKKDLYEEARKKAKSGDFEGAIADFTTLVSREKDVVKSAALELQIGNAYCECRKYNKALEHYASSLRLARKAKEASAEASALSSQANAYTELPCSSTKVRAANLKSAKEKYLQALAVFTRDEYPTDYATTQNNLGAAYTDLPSKDTAERARNVGLAIECYRAALEIRKKDEYPLKYAMTQNNLGVAYTALPSRDTAERTQNVQLATECFRAALEILLKDEYPQNYCLTAYNMGRVLLVNDPEEACYWLREAYSLRELLPEQGQLLEELIETVCKDKK